MAIDIPKNIRGISIIILAATPGSISFNDLTIFPNPKEITLKAAAISTIVTNWAKPTGFVSCNTQELKAIAAEVANNTRGNFHRLLTSIFLVLSANLPILSDIAANAVDIRTIVNNFAIPIGTVYSSILEERAMATENIPKAINVLPNPFKSPIFDLETFSNANAINGIAIANAITDFQSTLPTILKAKPIARTPAAISNTTFKPSNIGFLFLGSADLLKIDLLSCSSFEALTSPGVLRTFLVSDSFDFCDAILLTTSRIFF